MAALSPQLTAATQDSREGYDYRIADGIRSVIDSLRPGMLVAFSFGTWSISDSAQLAGHTISITGGNWKVIMSTRYSLPNVTLLPSAQYQVWLEGNSVRVSGPG